MSKSTKETLGYWEVTAIGVGGMVGGGIFAVLGLSVELSSGGAPVAFLIAGIVALVTSYSYAKLAVTFPSQGGTVAFLDRAFGSGLLTGTANIMLWISYMVMLSLYAYAFGSYGSSFFPPVSQAFWKHILITASVAGITGLNLLNARLIGKAEDWIVLLKLVILSVFIGVGIWGVDSTKLAPSTWSSPSHLIAGDTGSKRSLSLIGIGLCLGALGSLIWETANSSPGQLWLLFAIVGAAFFIESTFRVVTGRRMNLSRDNKKGTFKC